MKRWRKWTSPGAYPILVLVAWSNGIVGWISLLNGRLAEGAMTLLSAGTLALIVWAMRSNDRALAASRAVLVSAQADRALAEAARENVVLPQITLDSMGRIGKVEFIFPSLAFGESTRFGIPVIRGLPPMEMTIASSRGNGKTRMRLNWEVGKIEMLGSDDADLSYEEIVP